MTTKSQNAKIAFYLGMGFTLTALDALRLFGCSRAAARVAELRRAGMLIETSMVNVIGAHGPARVAQYALAKREGV